MWLNNESDFRLYDDEEDILMRNDSNDIRTIQVDNEGIVWDFSVYKEYGTKTVLEYIEEIKKSWNENIFVWISGAEEQHKEDKRKWILKGRKKEGSKQKKAQEIEPKEYEKLTALKKVKKFYEREIKGALIVTNENWKYYDISIK